MSKFVYDNGLDREPLRIGELLRLMGTNNARRASYLIPDLQRDYVWDHKKIINLVDTLMKGWPFGQILVAQTGRLSPRFSPRAFYSKIVRVGAAPCEVMNADLNSPDATLVLDGQQRLQSLFTALSPSSGGLVLDQKVWIESLSPNKSSGLWSGYVSPAAFLSVNVVNLAAAYEACRDVGKIDYSAQAKLPVLEWGFDHDIKASQLWSRRAMLPRFLVTQWGEDNTSELVFLKDLWEIENGDIQAEIRKRGISPDYAEAVTKFYERFVAIKQVPVPQLCILSREECGLDDDAYNEMILSVFTRLNAGGVELSEDEITFSWIKRYWPREDMSAEDAINALKVSLTEQGMSLKGGALVQLLSGIWADVERDGKRLNDADLLDGQLLKRVAAFLGANWNDISEQIVNVANLLRRHNLAYGVQYFSLHGFTILATWLIIGRLWANCHQGASRAEQISFDSLFGPELDVRIDRLIFACQWASSIGNYDVALNDLYVDLQGVGTYADACRVMGEWLDKQLHAYAESAKVAVNSLERATRAGVSAYTTQLWCWQRLDYDRKKVSEKLALEHGGITSGLPNVDHCVSYAFWEEFVGKFESSPKGSDVYNRLLAKINQIGNCNVLCKEINCSKGSKTMREFFKKIGLDESDVSPLAIPIEMISPDADALTPELVLEKIEKRTSLIRSDLCHFLDGLPTHRLVL